MKSRTTLSAIFLSGSLVFAQMGPGGLVPRYAGGGMRDFGPRAGKVVTGAPYYANVSNSSVKTLQDGNTISQTTTGFVARDSEGRTYSKETITGIFGQTGTKTIIFIADPVAGYAYSLNPDTKTAIKRELHAHSGPKPGSGFKSESAVRPVDPNVVKADLGVQTVNGVSAQGKSVTRTIPANTMGNTAPIVSTSQTWFSPDLQVVVSSKRSDPRQGTSDYELTGINRSEPDASLFQVPAGYTVKDAPTFGGPRP